MRETGAAQVVVPRAVSKVVKRFGDGFVPLQYAVMRNNDAETVALLIKAGASAKRSFVCAVDGKTYTILSYAGSYGLPFCV